MKLSLLFLVVFSQLLLLKAVHKGEASDLSELLEREITELKEENAKRGSRNPCAFTWTCRRRRRRKGRSFLEKRGGGSSLFNSFPVVSEDFDDALNDETK